MQRRFRLHRSGDIQRVRRTGKSYAHPLLVLTAARSGSCGKRLAVTAGVRVGGAVERNRARRRIREAARPLVESLSEGWDLLLTARSGAATARFEDLTAAVRALFQRAGVITLDGGNQSRADSDPSLRSLRITWNTLPRWPILAAIRLYQLTLARLIAPDTCRFQPTCSHYAYQAVFKYGIWKGGWLGFKRLIRCQPLSEGGYDPVP